MYYGDGLKLLSRITLLVGAIIGAALVIAVIIALRLVGVW